MLLGFKRLESEMEKRKTFLCTQILKKAPMGTHLGTVEKMNFGHAQ